MKKWLFFCHKFAVSIRNSSNIGDYKKVKSFIMTRNRNFKSNLKRNGIFIGLGIGIGLLLVSWTKPVREKVWKKLNPPTPTKKTDDDTAVKNPDNGDGTTTPTPSSQRLANKLKLV